MPAASDPHHIVITYGPTWPAVTHNRLKARKRLVQKRGVVARAEQVEALGHVKLVVALGVLGHPSKSVIITDFTHHGGVRICVE